MSFTPPQFKDISKSVSDLFNKKYDYNNSFKIKKSGAVSMETSGNFESGCVKTSFSRDGCGDFEITAGTCGKLGIKYDCRLNSNMKATVNGVSEGDKLSGDATVKFSQDSFIGSLKVASGGALNVSAVVGMDDLSVGGSFGMNFGKKEKKEGAADDKKEKKSLGDFNVGVQYSGFNNSILSVMSSNKMDSVSAGVFTKASDSLSVGTMVSCTTKNTSVGFAFEKVMDASTTVKGKISVGKNQGAAFAIQHALFDTNMKIGLAADLNAPYYNFPPSFKSVGLTLNL